MSITIIASTNLIIVIAKHNATSRAREASGVELETLVRLEILALDTAVAPPTDGIVKLVVVAIAVRKVLVDIEFRCGEGVAAGLAYETVFVIAAG